MLINNSFYHYVINKIKYNNNIEFNYYLTCNNNFFEKLNTFFKNINNLNNNKLITNNNLLIEF